MLTIVKKVLQASAIFFTSVMMVACVTETIESPSMQFGKTAVVSVGDPNASVSKGSTFAWLPEAMHFYEDKRLENEPLKLLLETEIIKNVKQQEMIFVDSVNGSKYAIAYTAALESSLDDSAIIQRYGLLPGISQLPENDSNVEKGSLILYVFENNSGNIIWRSAAQVGVEFDMPMEKRKERVVRVMAEMFQTFPKKK